METQTTKSSNDSLNKTGPLTFRQAIVTLIGGNKVKLPEWTGYWFSTGVAQEVKDGIPCDIRVMTKSGDILDTPWIEHYQDRTDWQITDGSLGFDWAINALKNGKKVRRRGWNGKGMFIFRQKGYPNGIEANKNTSAALGIKEGTVITVTPYLMMRAADGSLVTGWLASQTDMLAEDWELAE